MIRENELKQIISEQGYKHAYIAKQLNITNQSFSNKLNNKTEFKSAELKKLKTILNLSNDKFCRIFFVSELESNSSIEKSFQTT